MRDFVPALDLVDAAVDIGGDAIAIDAHVVGAGLGLEPDVVVDLMRRGAITGVYEQGVDDDAGRHRLTFFYESRRLRLIVADGGRVVRRSLIDFGDHPLPAGLRRSSA